MNLAYCFYSECTKAVTIIRHPANTLFVVCLSDIQRSRRPLFDCSKLSLEKSAQVRIGKVYSDVGNPSLKLSLYFIISFAQSASLI